MEVDDPAEVINVQNNNAAQVAPANPDAELTERQKKRKRKRKARKLRLADSTMPEEIDESLTELFKVMSCSICLNMSKKGACCPKCSILSCKPCIHHWMKMYKPRSCPQCKCLLSKQKYIKLPILPDLGKALEILRKSVAKELANLRDRVHTLRKQDQQLIMYHQQGLLQNYLEDNNQVPPNANEEEEEDDMEDGEEEEEADDE